MKALLLGALVGLLLLGCAGQTKTTGENTSSPASEPASSPTPVATPEPEPAQAAPPKPSVEDPPAPAGATVVKGTVLHRPEKSRGKNLTVWLGLDLVLKLADGTEKPLLGSDAVKREELEKLDGQEVELSVEDVPERAPHPMEQAPLGPDGKTMSRPAALRVLEIR